MKHAIHIIALFVCVLGFGSLQAQSLSQGSRLVDSELNLKGAQIQGAYVVISYEIPHSGMVELRLFDDAGQKIWQNQYVDKFGKNKIVLKASKFNPGETYAYVLNYKRDEVTEKIVIPPLGFE